MYSLDVNHQKTSNFFLKYVIGYPLIPKSMVFGKKNHS